MLFFKLGLATIGVAYLSVAAGMFALQREFQYFPTRDDPSPEAVGLENVRRIALPTDDGETVILWYAAPAANRPVVLFLHGNAGAMADRAERLAFYQRRGYGAAFLSWRGYGGSTGKPTESGLILDAEAAYRHLREQGFDARRIVVVGESLGSGVAVQLAVRLPVGAVVLEAPFTAAADIAAGAYPWLPVRLLMRDQYLSRNHIARIGVPLLILHGERDRVIPISQGRALFDLAAEPKSFVSLGPVGHEALSDPATWALGAEFIDRVFPP